MNDRPIDFAALRDLLAMTDEAVRRAAEIVRQSRAIQAWSRDLREEVEREARARPAPPPPPRRPH